MRAIALTFIFSALAIAEENWPQFRGPTGQGVSDARGLPLRWSETQNVKWKTVIPGEGWSSPVIWGNQIWLTSALDGGRSLHAVCVNRDSGKILYDIEVFKDDAPQFKHALNSFASPTPIVDGSRVFVHFGAVGTACLSTHDGSVLWKNRDLKLDHQMGSGSSPVLWRDKLIIPCDGIDAQYIVALDVGSGHIAWRTNRTGKLDSFNNDQHKAFSTPLVITVNGQPQVVTPAAHHLYTYDPQTGREIWRSRYSGYSTVSRPVFDGERLYISTGYDRAELVAFRPDGTGDVSVTHVAWTYKKQVSQKPSFALAGDRLYMVSDGGIVSCLETKTGREIWQHRISGEYSASPIVADGRIYFFSQLGATTIIEPNDIFKVIATNQLDSGFMASPAVTGKALFLRTKTHLYRIEEQR